MRTMSDPAAAMFGIDTQPVSLLGAPESALQLQADGEVLHRRVLGARSRQAGMPAMMQPRDLTVPHTQTIGLKVPASQTGL